MSSNCNKGSNDITISPSSACESGFVWMSNKNNTKTTNLIGVKLKIIYFSLQIRPSYSRMGEMKFPEMIATEV